MPLPSKVHSVYRFGVFELDADTGELRRNGSRLRLQDQPYHVLLKLLEHAGQTVTRDELRKTLWPADTFVDFETGLNTTIKRLRETLKDSAENPAFIETVPKRGYRFIAPVSTQVAGPETKADKAMPFSHVRVNRFVLLGAVLILALLPVGFALRRWDTQLSLPARVLDFAQLTNDSQAKQGRLLSDGYRIYFSEVLPVGRIVAQVSAKGGETTTIPSSVLDPRPVDLSPDGTELLILSGDGSKSEEPHGDTLWILPVAGGSGRPVGNILATDALWGERGETILYCDGHDLYSVNRDGSNQRKLLTLSGYVESLRWSPDRHFVRFTMTTRNMGRTSSIWEVSANGTGLRQIVPGIPGSVACCGVWMAGTDRFLFQWTHAGRSDLWETSGSHSVLRPGPTRLTAGPMSYSEPAASGLRNEVFVVGSIPRAELVKYVADKAELVPYLSGISAEGVEVSRDGQSVAYTLYPEGTLWRSNIAGSERVQLTFAPMRAFLPRWSPDGKQIAFMGTVNGEHWTTYIISAQGGLARQMIPGDDETADATWMPSNRTIIFGPWSNSRSRGIKALDLRLRIRDRKLETVVDLKNLDRLSIGTFMSWSGLAADDSVLLSRNNSTQEIYAVKW